MRGSTLRMTGLQILHYPYDAGLLWVCEKRTIQTTLKRFDGGISSSVDGGLSGKTHPSLDDLVWPVIVMVRLDPVCGTETQTHAQPIYQKYIPYVVNMLFQVGP